MKTCTACGETKPLEKFHRDKYMADGRTGACAQCRTRNTTNWNEKNKERYKANHKRWVKANPERVAEHSRKTHVKTTYGISMEQYEAMLEDDCPICRKPLERPHVDHCHATLVVRGVLCNKCNSGIGMLGDDITTLQRAIEYLRDHAKGHPILQAAAVGDDSFAVSA